jgi:hypothetical protein
MVYKYAMWQPRLPKNNRPPSPGHEEVPHSSQLAVVADDMQKIGDVAFGTCQSKFGTCQSRILT